MLDDTCRLCLQSLRERLFYDIFDDRLCIKIMTLLGLECEENDLLPTKVCDECRYKLDSLYIFKTKSTESDGALRKLIATTGKVRENHLLNEAAAFVSGYKEAPTQGSSSREATQKSVQKTESVDIMDDEDDFFEVEVHQDDQGLLEEEHIEYDDYDSSNQEFGLTSPSPSKRLKTTSETKPFKLREAAQGQEYAQEESDELKDIHPPYSFPLRTADEVHKTEAWMNNHPLHFQKIVYLVKRKLAHSSLDRAVKKLFEYEIVHHFWHPKGQKRPGGTSISSLRIFTDVFEEAVKEFEDIDIDLMFRFFFKNARNCLRARKSRLRHRTLPSGRKIAPIKDNQL